MTHGVREHDFPAIDGMSDLVQVFVRGTQARIVTVHTVALIVPSPPKNVDFSPPVAMLTGCYD